MVASAAGITTKRQRNTRSPSPVKRVGRSVSRSPNRVKANRRNRREMESNAQPSTEVVEEKPQYSMAYCVSVCVAYGATSVAITFTNKALLSLYNFHFELSLFLAQLLIGTGCIVLLFASGLCTAPPLSSRYLITCFPLSLWFFLYVITGLGSLRSLTVPLWSAMRRLTAIFILTLDYLLDGKIAYWKIWASVLLMLGGALVAAYGDLDGDVRGYVQVISNCVSSALYLRAVTYVKKETGLSELSVLFYTNICCLPLALAAIAYFDEASAVAAFPSLHASGFQTALLCSSVMAGLLNYLVFLSATVNSPLTTSITGQAKNVVGSFGGFVLMPTRSNESPMHLLGCAIGLAASIWYAILKFSERRSQTGKREGS